MNNRSFLHVVVCIAASLLFSLLTLSVSAQQTDFSGNWQLKDQQSISGKLYSNGVPKTMHVTQSAKSIIIEKNTAAADGKDAITTDTLTFNGKPFSSITSSGRHKQTSLSWNAEKTAFSTIGVAQNLTDKSKNDFKTTDNWSIENDQLILRRKSENFINGEVWESKAIYEKQ